jgi:hypothetical protein
MKGLKLIKAKAKCKEEMLENPGCPYSGQSAFLGTGEIYG